MYEYVTLYENEKLEIVVTEGRKEIDRLDVTTMLTPVSELPANKVSLFYFSI